MKPLRGTGLSYKEQAKKILLSSDRYEFQLSYSLKNSETTLNFEFRNPKVQQLKNAVKITDRKLGNHTNIVLSFEDITYVKEDIGTRFRGATAMIETTDAYIQIESIW